MTREQMQHHGLTYAESVVDLMGDTPLVKLNRVAEGAGPARAGQGRVLQPRRLGQGPDRQADDRGRRGRRRSSSRAARSSSRPRATPASGLALVAQQRGLPVRLRLPRQGQRGQAQRAQGLRRRGRRLPDRRAARPPGLLLRRLRPAGRARSTAPGSPTSTPTPRGPPQPLRDHRPGDLAATPTARVTHFVDRRRHRRHDHRHRPLPQGGLATGRPCGSIGADPEGSVYSGGTGRPYLVEGVGEDFWPAAYDPSIPDEIVAVSDADSFEMTRRLAREEGLLVGGSCGMAVVAALRVGRGLRRRRRRRRAAARRRPRLPVEDLQRRLDGAPTASCGADGERDRRRRAAAASRGELPALVHTHPSETVRDADRDPARVRRLADAGRAGRAAGDVRRGGRVGERARAARRRLHRAARSWPTGSAAHGAGRCRWSAPGEPVDAARHALENVDAVMVSRTASRSGVLTRHDLLGFFAG